VLRTLKSHSLQWLFCCLVVAVLGGCARLEAPVRLGGATMGTTWSVTYVAGSSGAEPAQLQRDIEERLAAVNASMSTYDPDSAISRFNAWPVGEPFRPDAAFVEVLETALTIGGQTGGAYDVTVGPLVELWGFGPSTRGYRTDVPDRTKVEAARRLVGQSGLSLDDEGALRKHSALALDFSSLAKGYAVDQIAALLQLQGVRRYLVEVGGEMALSGLSPRGNPWQIAIEQPETGERSVAAALSVSDIAIATSGDYRNYFVYEGKRYSHTIDPRTGYPVDHELVSVTVLHASAMVADAWATALTVLGLEQAMALAQEYALAVYCIAQRNGKFVHRYTAAMQPYLAGAAGTK